MDMFLWIFFHNDIKKHEPKIFYKASVCKTIVGFLYVVTKYGLLLRSLFFNINNFLQEERLFHRKGIKLVLKVPPVQADDSKI